MINFYRSCQKEPKQRKPIANFWLILFWMYCGIIRIHGGSIFVAFVGTPHPQIYILNEKISKFCIKYFNEKRNGMQHFL